MNFSNVVATVPAVMAPSVVGAFVFEYVSDSYVCDVHTLEPDEQQ